MDERVNRKIKVAEVLRDGTTGGVISCVMNYFRHIDKDKFQVDFYMNEESPYSKEIESLGGRVFYYPKVTNYFQSFKTLKSYFKKEQYDIVHSHMTTLAFICLHAAKQAGIKIRICHSHSTTNYREGLRWLIKCFLRPIAPVYATNLAACGGLSAKWLYRNKAKDCFIMYNAIDCNKFDVNKYDKEKLKKQLGIQDKKVVGLVGRFAVQKNVTYMIDIFNKLAKDRDDVVLLLVGDGVKRKDVEERIDSYNLHDKVLIMDECKDVEKYYSIMDVFCLTSLYEGLPLVVVEAQAMGLECVISSEITDEVKLSDLVHFVDLGDDQTWVNALNKILDTDYKKINRIKNGKYDINMEVNRLENYYESLVEGKNL